MSLWCGGCREEIFSGFSILYRLTPFPDGSLQLPDRKKDIFPPNSAVCDTCLKKLPKINRLPKTMQEELEQGKERVYALIPADSRTNPFGSKSWSSIVTDDNKLVFLRHESVTKHFPKAIEIINGMEDN